MISRDSANIYFFASILTRNGFVQSMGLNTEIKTRACFKSTKVALIASFQLLRRGTVLVMVVRGVARKENSEINHQKKCMRLNKLLSLLLLMCFG